MLNQEELKYEKPSLLELYIAPEIARGDGEVTSSTEVYRDPNGGDDVIVTEPQ